MTLQEAFNKVWERAKDKRRSVRPHTHGTTLCAYRGNDGLKCFIGVLIPDEQYSADMETTAYENVLKAIGFNDTYQIRILAALQKIHDTVSACNWESELRRIAANAKFTVPE